MQRCIPTILFKELNKNPAKSIRRYGADELSMI